LKRRRTEGEFWVLSRKLLNPRRKCETATKAIRFEDQLSDGSEKESRDHWASEMKKKGGNLWRWVGQWVGGTRELSKNNIKREDKKKHRENWAYPTRHLRGEGLHAIEFLKSQERGDFAA